MTFEIGACLLVIVGFLSKVNGCEDHWSYYDGKCYYLSSGSKTFTGAENFCDSHRGELASVSSVGILGFLSSIVSLSLHGIYWVGVKNRDEQLEWFDGTPTTGQPWIDLSYTDINPNLNRSASFTLQSDKIVWRIPQLSAAFICSKNNSAQNYAPEGICPQNITHLFNREESGDCIFVTEAVTYANASAECSKHGGHILNKRETSLIRIQQLFGDDVSIPKFWVHLTVQELVILRSPERNPPETPCAAVVKSRAAGDTFAVGRCSEELPVLCIKLAPQQQVRQAGVLRCPEGTSWKAYKEECFWETSFESPQRSWEDSRRFCQGFGGDLASFHSKEEERAGLNTQHRVLDHPFWIGLRLDPATGNYTWSDGSPLDHTNWKEGQPDHREGRMRCVALNAREAVWEARFCGIMSWWVCRVPMRNRHTQTNAPRTPLVPCRESKEEEEDPHEYFYRGYCYSVGALASSWHRASYSCKNNDASQLVSIHSNDEISFLLRMLDEVSAYHTNRVWIGLNTLRGDARWSDSSPLDLAFWSRNEPNNWLNQEKCTNMYAYNGSWNDENCNAEMGFICKRLVNATDVRILPSTPDPTIGYCKKGWHKHYDRCYYPVGKLPKDRVNWTIASHTCQEYGGYLAAVRDEKDQAFLSYLLQDLSSDTWIGLRDVVETGRFFWMDNSDLTYYNWAMGEPSFYGIKEDCAKMVYDNLPSGVWRDDVCSKKLAYICQREKDSNEPDPGYDRGIYCLQPEGYVKLNDQCFKMYQDNRASWQDAERACEREGAHLLSVTSSSVQAVADYLESMVNHTYWIGLKYSKSTQKVSWTNNWPVNVTRWGQTQPGGRLGDDSCFASTSEGYWEHVDCSSKLPYICHITTGKPPPVTRVAGSCPLVWDGWIPSDGSFCFLFGSRRLDWYSAVKECFRHGGFLASLHSIEDAKRIIKNQYSTYPSYFIGLHSSGTREGFTWLDYSPVDFVDWDENQPEPGDPNDPVCVELMADTLKWRVVDCLQERYYVCAVAKDGELNDLPENAKRIDVSGNQISPSALAAIILCSFLMVAAILLVIFWYRDSFGRSILRNPFRHQSMSFENALYNADTASMQFEDDTRNSCDTL